MDAKTRYEKRMQTVCQYIYQHLDEELTVEILSEVAHFSKHHFHRQFSEYMGINVFKFIQQLRLKRASYELVFRPEKRIVDIAMDAQFDHPESFSRAFKKTFGQSPRAFRQEPNWLNWRQECPVTDNQMEQSTQVNIVEFTETPVAAYEHRGPFGQIVASSSAFQASLKHIGITPLLKGRSFGLVYNDPKEVAPEDFRYDLAVKVTQPIIENDEGIVRKVLPGGRCAVLRHLGSRDNLDDSVRTLYGAWLPNSGEELRDAPCFFAFLNSLADVAEHELITDIYLPLI
ncbi:Right origin-binding protein [Marinomonas spartinae]|uniref:Right origin-binding protein n=1 Tax=Marinomonas spartinae TaxID=1792290 RepID=A0A1A8SZZ4_9GAMM|nr:AraC family transcriptional regulator [Marinomonas spartinae]SBS24810.1 Right origin-binding protein [Marinomonas spartinae]